MIDPVTIGLVISNVISYVLTSMQAKKTNVHGEQLKRAMDHVDRVQSSHRKKRHKQRVKRQVRRQLVTTTEHHS